MKNTNESGRSMVEMLGVLAIIGVLSIGGIAGYTLAMNRYRANEILNAAALVSIAATSANGGAGQDNTNLTALGGIDSLTLPGIDNDDAIYGNADGTVVIQINSEYDKVGNLVRTLSGNRIEEGTSSGNTYVVLNMQNAVKKN